MSKLLSYLRDKHTLWFKLTLMFCCLLFIVVILPDPNKTEFSYEIGQAWENEDLIAPFDFAVYKSGAEVSTEQSIIRASMPLYYTENDSAFRKNINLFFQNNKLSGQQEQLFHNIFNTLLSKEIIQLPDSGSTEFAVWIIKDKAITERDFNEFYTILQADSFLSAFINKNFPASEAGRLSEPAENTLVHTLTYDKELTRQNLNQELNDLALIKDKRIKGQSIINTGDVVDAGKAEILS